MPESAPQSGRLKRWARALKDRCLVLALAMKHPRTPWYAKAVGGLTLVYALSPVDLIPDFIPVVGHLDDFLIVPLGVWLTVKLVPREVWAECEAEAARREGERLGRDWRGALLVAAFWLLVLAGCALAIWRMR